MSDVANVESTEKVVPVKPLVYDKAARTVRIENVEDFRVAAKFFGIPVKDKGALPLKALAQHVLRLNWTILPTDKFSNATALGGKVAWKEKAPESVWTVNYRKVHNNGGTGPIQTATVTLADVRTHTGITAGRVGPKRLMVTLAKMLELPLSKLTTAGHTFEAAQSDDVTTPMLAGTVAEVDQTVEAPEEIKADDTAKAAEVAEIEKLLEPVGDGRAAVLESANA